MPTRFVTKIFSTQHKNESQKKLLVILNMAFTYIMNFFFGQNKAQKSHKTDRKQYKKFLDPLPTISNEH